MKNTKEDTVYTTNRFFIIIDYMVMKISKEDLSKEVFTVTYGSSYQLQVSKTEDGYKITNGVDGYGSNCLKEFEKTEVIIVKEILPLKAKEDTVQPIENPLLPVLQDILMLCDGANLSSLNQLIEAVKGTIELADNAIQEFQSQTKTEDIKLSNKISHATFTTCSICNKPITETGTAYKDKPCHIKCFHQAESKEKWDRLNKGIEDWEQTKPVEGDLLSEIERRQRIILSEPNGIVRETMIQDLLNGLSQPSNK